MISLGTLYQSLPPRLAKHPAAIVAAFSTPPTRPVSVLGADLVSVRVVDCAHVASQHSRQRTATGLHVRSCERVSANRGLRTEACEQRPACGAASRQQLRVVSSPSETALQVVQSKCCHGGRWAVAVGPVAPFEPSGFRKEECRIKGIPVSVESTNAPLESSNPMLSWFGTCWACGSTHYAVRKWRDARLAL